MKEKQRALIEEAAKYLELARECLQAATGETGSFCKHPNPTNFSGMGDKVKKLRCSDCGHQWAEPLEDVVEVL